MTADDLAQVPAPAPRKRGRPRKYPDGTPKLLTAAQRSELGRATWKNRPVPDYRRHDKTITAAAEVIDALAVMRGELTWTAFFCERFGIPKPPDRRFNISK